MKRKVPTTSGRKAARALNRLARESAEKRHEEGVRRRGRIGQRLKRRPLRY